MSGQDWYFCLSWAWQRRRGGYRVRHLHWPRSGIVSCTRAAQAREIAEEGR